MKRIAGSILLIASVVLPGCSKPNSEVAKSPSQEVVHDKHAANMLTIAKDFQNEGNTKSAIKTLNELLEQFPDSKSAVEAKQMLAKIVDPKLDNGTLDPAGQGSDADVAEVEEGGVKNTERDKVEAYFVAFAKIQSVEEERKLLADFGGWLAQRGYKISATKKNGKHELTCPYFPPVTPWTTYSFLDIKNLELLPRLQSGG